MRSTNLKSEVSSRMKGCNLKVIDIFETLNDRFDAKGQVEHNCEEAVAQLRVENKIIVEQNRQLLEEKARMRKEKKKVAQPLSPPLSTAQASQGEFVEVVRRDRRRATSGKQVMPIGARPVAGDTPARPSKKSRNRRKRPKSTHPLTSEMVTAAIKELKDRRGSSLQVIKKYVVATYKVDGEKVTPFIKKYLKNAVSTGAVVQTKGKGASESFKLSTIKASSTKAKAPRVIKEKKVTDKSVEKKTAAARKSAATAVAKKIKAPAKKAETVKKAADPKKSKIATSRSATAAAAAAAAAAAPITTEKKVAKKPATPKAVSKANKTAKAPAAKTRTPKPKKTTAKAVAKK
ncbi:late histone H1-like [Polistes fuscatus]|uniref:late histone H1-like n=1 Tax=Polistes fuscatus TaxID=30207 RepID=UPI001CA84863|nr:late histone H1-like [Polistes fuscatus]